MHLAHTAVWVSDIDRTAAFYEGALDLAFHREFEIDGVRNYFVGSEDGAEIQFKCDSDSRDSEGRTDTRGFDHLAFSVDDVDATFERVVEATDCPVAMEPTTIEQIGSRVAFVADPDGYEVEFEETLR